MKKTLIAVTSIILVVCMLFAMVSVSAASVDNSTNNNGALIDNNMNIHSTNSLGAMISDKLGEEQEKQEENNGINIFSVEIEGNVATAEIETVLDATIIVGIYSEDGVEMYASGKTEIFKDDEMAEVTIDIETMPQYFYLKAYIVDSESLKPLCTVYESPNYTREMQEFFAKTVEDFDEEKVLNLDSDDTNNFAVYNDDVKLIESTADSANELVTADDDKKIYVIENADESITSLKEGEIFSYAYDEENVIIVKVKTVTVEGTTATITGEEIEMSDVFDYVRIDGASEMSNSDYSTIGKDEDVLVINQQKTENTKAVETVGAAEISGNISTSLSFELKKENKEKGISIKGGFDLGVSAGAKVFLSLSYQYVELSIGYKLNLYLSLTVKSEVKIPIGYIGISPCPGVFVDFTPSLVLECSGTIEVNGTLTGSVGLKASLQKGIQNTSKSPKLEAEIKAEITVFVGISLEPRIKVLGSIVSATLGAKVGAEVKATLSKKVSTDTTLQDEHHDCNMCVEGSFYAKFGLSFELKFLNNDKFKLKFTLLDVKIKITDFYFSIDNTDFGLTKCPYKSYLVTVIVEDSYRSPISVADVSYGNQQLKTNQQGIARLYLADGIHTITASLPECSASKKVEVNGKAVTVEININGEHGGSGMDIGGHGGSGTSFGEQSGFDFTDTGNIAAVEANANQTAVLTKDGTVYLWGANYSSQLAYTGGLQVLNPYKLNGAASGIPENSVKQIALGYEYSAVVLKDGSLYTWGKNTSGQLGDGTTTHRPYPVKIMDNVKKVSLGDNHSAALLTDGSLYTWGSNNYGKLGNSKGDSCIYTPIKILNNVKDVSVGYEHTLILLDDGAVYACGYNFSGQLGTGSTGGHGATSTPRKVMDNVVSVFARRDNSSAITNDGTLYAWGDNNNGSLGNGASLHIARPEKIAYNIVSVSIGSNHSAAVTKDGALYTWGYNAYGELGNGDTINYRTPQHIRNDVAFAAAGSNHTIIATKGGQVYTCGYNEYGQLGNGATSQNANPSFVEIPIYDYTPFLSENGIIHYKKISNSFDFTDTGNIAAVEANTNQTAVLTKDGTVYLWGANYSSQLAYTGGLQVLNPYKLNGAASGIPENSVKQIALGYEYSAVVLKDGSLYTWGKNTSGQLGDGTTTHRPYPVKIMDNVKKVSLGDNHSAALSTDGSLYTWGNNYYGQLGNGKSGSNNYCYTPVKIMDNVKDVSVGYEHTLILLNDGAVYACGYNFSGQLGTGSTGGHGATSTPRKVMDNVVSVFARRDNSSAITNDGTLYAWGDNNNGSLGNGASLHIARPEKIAYNIVSVSIGSNHSAAVTKDGALYTWGYNAYGELGNGDTINYRTPQHIRNDVAFAAAGSNHTIIVTKGGQVYTCGYNEYGQLGNGVTSKTANSSFEEIPIYDHTPTLTAKSAKKYTEIVGANANKTTRFSGLKAGAVYNFYSLKSKATEDIISKENLLYIAQVEADENGNIEVTYNPREEYITPYEFVASMTHMDISKASVTDNPVTYNGLVQRYSPTIKFGNYTLYENIDFELNGIYSAVNAGEYVVEITGKGDFVGSLTETFTITQANVNVAEVVELDNQEYIGEPISQSFIVKDSNRTLVKDTDYTVKYQNATDLGLRIVEIKGIGNYTGRKVCWFDISENDINTYGSCEAVKYQAYTGVSLTPEPTVTFNGNILVKNQDYTVEYKDNISVGTATIIVKGIGNYTGALTTTFEIINNPMGDVNLDGTLTILDVTLLQRYLVELANYSDEQFALADANQDGEINIADATYLQMYISN